MRVVDFRIAGRAAVEAVRAAAIRHLRAIVMTSPATVAGAVPLLCRWLTPFAETPQTVSRRLQDLPGSRRPTLTKAVNAWLPFALARYVIMTTGATGA